MAGDWIKVEHATVDKPEVGLFSELLGVPTAQGFGLLVMFWMWCDKHSCNGVVTHVSRMSIDNATHTSGFSAALESVGWGVFNDVDRTLTLPNFTRHNENTAKSRALCNERVKRHRNAATVTEPLPEKRREESLSTNVDRDSAPKKSALSEPSAQHRAMATELGVDCQAEFVKYRDWLAANGRRQNQDAGFRNWLRKAAEFRRPAKQSARDAVAAQIFGASNERTDERVIDGEVQRVA